MNLICENCRWYSFDDDLQEYFCDAVLDEDEYSRLLKSFSNEKCEFFIPDGGEYEIVKKQN